ncbi:MAG: AsmA family protein, partial [Desulfobulbaceae bacterium]|nr:AsmA family protein [Desulfobulbaceae bacterium]
TASADMGVAIGASLADLKVNGDFDFVSDIIYGTAKPQLSGKGSFDNNKAVCNLTVNIDQQQVNLIAKANDLNAKPLPPIQLDINSDKLNIDKLMALTDKLPQAPADKKTKQTAKTKKTAISAGLPPGLIVTGSVKVNEALYNKLAVRDFSLLYNLKDGIATMTDLSFKTAGGKLAGKARVDLTTTEPTYKGDLNIDALQIQELLASFASPQANILAGGMAADLNFSGTGFSVDQIKNFLHLDATYGMQKAKLSETPISNAVATILQLEQIKTMTLDKVDGNLQLKNGKLSLHSQLDGKDLKLQTNGNVNINSGALDLPLKLEFSGALAEQLQQKSSFMKYLSTKEGTTALNLKLTGSTSDPKATLDEKAAEKQIKKQLEKKVVDEIGKELFGSSPSEDKNKSAEPVKQLFKGLFGN